MILRRVIAYVGFLSLASVCAIAEAQQIAVTRDLQALSKAPATHPAPGFESKGVRALFYDGLPWQGKPTRVFAWYGAPPVTNGHKLPAMVLVHGGGGTAFDYWVRLWNNRGYAAIAMDTCGQVPKGKYGAWERHEMGGPPGWGGFDQIDQPTADQWTYHAIADVILANSLIRTMSEVDPDRIGITGISWGGYLTCIAAGVDHRFKFAVPVYGCGFLGDNSVWLDTFKQMGTEKAGQWLRLWDPSVYVKAADMPLMWVTGTNDFAYPMDSLKKSYRLPQGPRTVCVRIRMPHAHGGPGENPEEIRAFADSILKDGKPLAKVMSMERRGDGAIVQFKSATKITKAELVFTKDLGKWQDRKWESIEAKLADGSASAALPDGVKVCYFNLTDDRGLVVSSEHVETR